MKLNSSCGAFDPWLPIGLCAAIAGSSLAQNAPSPPSSARDETVMLSPFVLQEDQDTGYAPNETLSGTRLRTQTKDVASAMTIVTPDLMKDLGAFNYNDVLNFMPSTATYVNLGTDD